MTNMTVLSYNFHVQLFNLGLYLSCLVDTSNVIVLYTYTFIRSFYLRPERKCQ